MNGMRVISVVQIVFIPICLYVAVKAWRKGWKYSFIEDLCLPAKARQNESASIAPMPRYVRFGNRCAQLSIALNALGLTAQASTWILAAILANAAYTDPPEGIARLLHFLLFGGLDVCILGCLVSFPALCMAETRYWALVFAMVNAYAIPRLAELSDLVDKVLYP